VSSAIVGEFASEEVLAQLAASAGLVILSNDGKTITLGPSSPSSRGKQSQVQSQQPEEIIVTAEKRTERLQDVPVSVTAVSASTLRDENKLRLQDYYTQIPGLTVYTGNTGITPSLTIYGLSSIFGNATVGSVFDDVPLSGFTNTSGTSGVNCPAFAGGYLV
jgi:outer membrane receptor protein involved in Fe transport